MLCPSGGSPMWSGAFEPSADGTVLLVKRLFFEPWDKETRQVCAC
jgi:hypothetical protein